MKRRLGVAHLGIGADGGGNVRRVFEQAVG